MINLSKSGNTIVFVFDNNDHYLQQGTIEVPVNSLSLVTDNSQMATFKKAASNDIFVSALYSDFGMTKEQLISFYKDNMVGGGGGDIPTEEIQEMIDESLSSATSGYADSVIYNSTSHYVEFYHNGTGGTKVYEFDASDFIVDGMIDDVRIETISGTSYLVIDFNTASGKEDIQIPLTDIFDPSNYYTKSEVDSALSGKADTTAVTEAISEAVSGKADTSAVTESINAAVSGKADTSAVTEAISEAISGKADTSAVTESINAAVSGKVDTSTFETYSGNVESALSGKQDTLSAGTNITISGNVISAEGGGKAVSGGTNISVTTGETADTINCTLPIRISTETPTGVIIGGNNNQYIADTCANSVVEGTGGGILSSSYSSHKEGYNSMIGMYANSSHVEGYECKIETNSKYSHAEGYYTKTQNESEHSSGRYNVSNKTSSTFGDSGNTLFSVGNGTSNNARHNAFEIRQNGDIYITLNGQDVKLQDNLGGGSITIDPSLDSGSTNPVANSAITNAIDAKQDILSAGTGIVISGNVISATGGGGSGKAIEAGRGISLTTGETADTVSFNLPIYQGKGNNSISITQPSGTTQFSNNVSGYSTTAIGAGLKVTNHCETAMGLYNVNTNVIDGTPFGNSDATLFSVGNGSGTNQRHNAIEVKQNGDIYIADTNNTSYADFYNKPMIKLQDALGSGAIVSTAITSGDTNAVAGGAVYDKFDEVETVTAAALNQLNDAFGGMKLQKVTQAEYDALVSGGTVDSMTLYVVTNS